MRGDRRERCVTCGAVIHGFHHYGSFETCNRIEALLIALGDIEKGAYADHTLAGDIARRALIHDRARRRLPEP